MAIDPFTSLLLLVLGMRPSGDLQLLEKQNLSLHLPQNNDLVGSLVLYIRYAGQHSGVASTALLSATQSSFTASEAASRCLHGYRYFGCKSFSMAAHMQGSAQQKTEVRRDAAETIWSVERCR